MKQGVDSSEDATPAKSSPAGSDNDDSSEETEVTAAAQTTPERVAPVEEETPKKAPAAAAPKNLLVDFVHSPAPQISSLVEITRGHDPITSAMPSSSLHSSQEDLTAPAAAAEGQSQTKVRVGLQYCDVFVNSIPI